MFLQLVLLMGQVLRLVNGIHYIHQLFTHRMMQRRQKCTFKRARCLLFFVWTVNDVMEDTIKSGTVDRNTIAKINFFPIGHIKQISNFPFIIISSLKILEGATKVDVLLFVTFGR